MVSGNDQSAHVMVKHAPAIPNLVFRRLGGPADYDLMAAVFNASREADGAQSPPESGETLERTYAVTANYDPSSDLLLVEVSGLLVGYNRVTWTALPDGTYFYRHSGFVLPQWRGKGLGRAMLRHAERRLLEIAAAHPQMGRRYFVASTTDKQQALHELLLSEDYPFSQEIYNMLRPHLAAVPEVPLPTGIAVRLVEPDHYRAIWAAEYEAFRDPWSPYAYQPIADFERWMAARYFQPDLWQVAWDAASDQVVGMVRNFIPHDENEAAGRLRGYTEFISVRRPWRGRGVARALLARSLNMHRERGMQEAMLGVEPDNPTGALHLYSSMGFRLVDLYRLYRKPIPGV